MVWLRTLKWYYTVVEQQQHRALTLYSFHVYLFTLNGATSVQQYRPCVCVCV